jgi:hypothetical protein
LEKGINPKEGGLAQLIIMLPVLVAATLAILILAEQLACMLHSLFAVYMQRSYALS